MPNIVLYILLGLVAGAFSGVVGLGGGVVIVPALVFLFGMTQHQAQGTTLAMLVPPIGILAASKEARPVTGLKIGSRVPIIDGATVISRFPKRK